MTMAGVDVAELDTAATHGKFLLQFMLSVIGNSHLRKDENSCSFSLRTPTKHSAQITAKALWQHQWRCSSKILPMALEGCSGAVGQRPRHALHHGGGNQTVTKLSNAWQALGGMYAVVRILSQLWTEGALIALPSRLLSNCELPQPSLMALKPLEVSLISSVISFKEPAFADEPAIFVTSRLANSCTSWI
jgi:hypothetical protein